MQSKDAIIRFFGTDYTEICKYIDKTQIEFYSEEFKKYVEYNREMVKVDDILYDILCVFLEKISTETHRLEVNGRNNILYNTLSAGNTYFQGLVGVVSSDILYKINDEEYILDITLEIHSRFDVVNNKIASPFFLTTMLKKGRELKTTGNDIKENPNDYFFDFLLVFKFATVLKEAYEKGYYRTYQKFQRNDDRLKGTIDIARYIKENMGMNNGKISYSHKEKNYK